MRRIVNAPIKIGLILALFGIVSCEGMLGKMASDIESIQQQFLAFMNSPEPEISVEYNNTVYTTDSSNPTITMPTPQISGVDNISKSTITLKIHNISNAIVKITNIYKSGNCADSFQVNPEQPSVDLSACSLANPPVCGETSFDITFISNDNNSGYNQVNISIQAEDNDGNSFAPFRLSVECLNPKETLIPKINIFDVSDLTTSLSSPYSFNFGNQQLYTQSAGKGFRISNSGTGDLSVTSITLTGIDMNEFKYYGPTSFTVSPGGSTDILLFYYPQHKGNHSADLTIQNNVSDFVLNLSGHTNAISVWDNNIISTGGNHDFGYIGADGNDRHASAYQNFIIKNDGLSSVIVSAINISGSDPGDFDLSPVSLPLTIPSNSNSLFRIRFDPITTGNKTATVAIESDDPDINSYSFNITGTGIQPKLEVSIQVTGMYFMGSGGNSYWNIKANNTETNEFTTIANLNSSNAFNWGALPEYPAIIQAPYPTNGSILADDTGISYVISKSQGKGIQTIVSTFNTAGGVIADECTLNIKYDSSTNKLTCYYKQDDTDYTYTYLNRTIPSYAIYNDYTWDIPVGSGAKSCYFQTELDIFESSHFDHLIEFQISATDVDIP